MRTSSPSESIHAAPKLLDLDAAAIAQTKVHIGNLVSEIAEFAKTCESPSHFYPAMLSRLVTAMAGIGAGVWQRSEDGNWLLVHSINLPESLILDLDDTEYSSERTASETSLDRLEKLVENELESKSSEKRLRIEAGHGDVDVSPRDIAAFSRKPSLEHLALLECVAREMQPILVPPGDIATNGERPTNPIQQCLIYSPIPIETGRERLWLLVVQPPSGGIATQRGYLRFVAQIADLTADFLKTFRLRQFENEGRLYAATQQLLADAAKSSDRTSKLTNMLQQLRELSGADQILIIQRTSSSQRWQIAMASGLRDLDQRSEGSQCVAEFCSWIVPQCSSAQPWITYAADRRTNESIDTDSSSSASLARDRFMTMFSAAAVTWLPIFGGTLEKPLGVGCIVYWSWPAKSTEQASIEPLAARVQTLARLGINVIRPPLLMRAIERSESRTGSLKSFIQQCLTSRWARITVAATIVAGIAMIPVPFRIVAPASLQPQLQNRHYAPLDARVVKVHVDYGDSVAAGQLLLELEDRNLSNLLDDATSQHLKSKERQRDIEARLLRSDRLPNDVRHELEGELELLRALSGNELQRIASLQKQMDLLTIRAAEDGVVATWNARQLLQDRPVRVGQLLLLVQQPSGPWTIDARLPQKDVGKFLKAVQQGMPIAHARLSSHPNLPISAVYQPNDLPAMLSASQNETQPSLCIRFAVPVSELPQRNAGSSAQISIDIGQGPFAWSIFGDAVLSLWAKVQLWI